MTFPRFHFTREISSNDRSSASWAHTARIVLSSTFERWETSGVIKNFHFYSLFAKSSWYDDINGFFDRTRSIRSSISVLLVCLWGCLPLCLLVPLSSPLYYLRWRLLSILLPKLIFTWLFQQLLIRRTLTFLSRPVERNLTLNLMIYKYAYICTYDEYLYWDSISNYPKVLFWNIYQSDYVLIFPKIITIIIYCNADKIKKYLLIRLYTNLPKRIYCRYKINNK